MKLKIAYFVFHFPYQSETYLLNQLKGLLDEGHHVTIFSIGRLKVYPKHALVDEYKLLSLTHERPSIPKNKLLRLLKALFLLIRNFQNASYLLRTLNILKYGKYAANLQFFYDTIPYVQEQEFDIVHCQFGPNGIKALNFREIGLLKGELLTSFYGADLNDKEFLSWPDHYSRKGLYKELSQACNIFTVLSEFSKQTAINLGIPTSKIQILPVGLDTKKFSRQPHLKTTHNFLVLTVARLVPFKGLKYGIKAMYILLCEIPNLEYHIIGEGTERAYLESLIQEFGIQDRVILHGAATQEQVLMFYNQADVFLLPSIQATDGEVETQGLVIQEAQSMELPVVVTNTGGIPEGLLDGKTGFIVPPNDAETIAEKINFLFRNSDLRQKMGKNGRAFVVERYDNQILHQKLLRLYSQLLSRK